MKRNRYLLRICVIIVLTAAVSCIIPMRLKNSGGSASHGMEGNAAAFAPNATPTPTPTLMPTKTPSPTPTSTPTPTPTPTPIQYKMDFGAELYSPHILLLRLSDGMDLIYKVGNSVQKVYPASITKIMTALVALEYLEDLGERITLSGGMFAYLEEEKASIAGYRAGEQVPALDLLYGLLLPSGAECGIGLAEYIAGSEEKFVELMNIKAWRLGMSNTRFCNTSGLHDYGHYTCTKDIAVLLRCAIQNDTLRTILCTAEYVTQPTNLRSEGLHLKNTMFNAIDDPIFLHGQILGGKTGFTDEAGQCLASFAEVYGEVFMLITCGAQGRQVRQQWHVEDALAIYGAIVLND